MSELSNKYLLCVLGPTASGKTGLAIHLAQQFSAQIVSCDARQFYRQMEIGTAKPDAEERAAAPHHFIDCLDLEEHFNAGKFEAAALPFIAKLHQASELAILVGGSGLYAKAITDGFDDLPPRDEKLREELEAIYAKEGIEPLQDKLREIDPDTYPKIDHLNPRRLMRAIEVFQLTGRSFLSFHNQKKASRPFQSIKIALRWDRQELYKRINQRVDIMMKKGLLEEVKKLLPFAHLNSMQTVGYREFWPYLRGEISLEEAVENLKQNSRRYAKRQMTWFKKDTDIQWFDPNEKEKIVAFVSQQMTH